MAKNEFVTDPDLLAILNAPDEPSKSEFVTDPDLLAILNAPDEPSAAAVTPPSPAPVAIPDAEPAAPVAAPVIKDGMIDGQQILADPQQTPVLTSEKQDKPVFGIVDTASGLIDMTRGAVVTAPASAHLLVEGLKRPDLYGEATKAALEKSDAFEAEMQAKTADRQAKGKSSSVGETFRETGPSLPFSGLAMAAAIPARMAGKRVGTAAGAAIGARGGTAGAATGGTIGGAVGETGAGMLASGAVAYRIAGAQFLHQTFKELQKNSMAKNKRPLNESEKKDYYEQLLPIAEHTAMWEAGPEAVSNTISLRAGKVILGLGRPVASKVAKKALMGRIIEKSIAAAKMVATEVGTETITQVEQNGDQLRAAAIQNGADPELIKTDRGLGSWIESMKQVAPQTLATILVTAGVGGGVKVATLPFTNTKAETAPGAEPAPASEVPLSERPPGFYDQQGNPIPTETPPVNEQDAQGTPEPEAVTEDTRPTPADAVPPGDVGGGAGGAGTGDVAGPGGPVPGDGGTTEIGTTGGEPVVAETPAAEPPNAGIPASQQPSKILPVRAEENAPPRPARQGRDTSARDAWDETYGDFREGGRTHNDDGTPFQPTVLDDTVQRAAVALRAATMDEKIDAVGTDIGAELNTGLRQLLDDGWVWDDTQKRMIDPLNRGETPANALNRIRTAPEIADSISSIAARDAAEKQAASDEAAKAVAAADAAAAKAKDQEAVKAAADQAKKAQDDADAAAEAAEAAAKVAAGAQLAAETQQRAVETGEGLASAQAAAEAVAEAVPSAATAPDIKTDTKPVEPSAPPTAASVPSDTEADTTAETKPSPAAVPATGGEVAAETKPETSVIAEPVEYDTGKFSMKAGGVDLNFNHEAGSDTAEFDFINRPKRKFDGTAEDDGSKGNGPPLIKAMEDHLRGLGVKLITAVSENKPKLIKYYRDLGYVTGKKVEDGIAMTKDLTLPAPGNAPIGTPAEADADTDAKAVDTEPATSKAILNAKLPDTEREVVERVIGEDTVSDIADDMGMTEQQVQRAWQRAKKRIEGDQGNLGPGAANINEEFAAYEERKFGRRLKDDPELADEIKDEVDLYYEVKSMKKTRDEAESLIGKNGEAWAMKAVTDEKISPDVRASIGQIMGKRFNERAKIAKAAGDEEGWKVNMDSAIDILNDTARSGTSWGRAINMLKDWTRLGPDGMVRTYQKVIEKTREKAKTKVAGAKDLVDTIKKTKKETFEQMKAKILKEKNPAAKRLTKTTWDKLRDLHDKGLLTDSEVWNAVAKDLKLPVYDKDFAREISSKMEEAMKKPEGFQRNRAINDIMQDIGNKVGWTKTDLYIAFRYANMLSGIGTQEVNFGSAAMAAFVNTAIRQMALHLTGNHIAAKGVWGRLLKGYKKGVPEAIHALKTGERVFRTDYGKSPGFWEANNIGTKGGVHLGGDSAVSMFLGKVLENPLAKPIGAMRYIFRLMSAADVLNYAAAKEVEFWTAASDTASKTGLRGKELMKETTRLLNETDTAWQAAMQQASDEGLAGTDQKFRAIEIIEASIPSDIRDMAMQIGLEWTFNQEPQGLLGKVAKQIDLFANDKDTNAPKILKTFVVPFTRIVANVSNYYLDFTPWGYKRAMIGHFGADAESSLKRTEHALRATVGIATTAAIAGLVEAGVMAISGGGPDDKEKRRQWMESGGRPYSVRFKKPNGEWTSYVSYRYTPMGMMLAVLGNYHDWKTFEKGSEKDFWQRTGYAMAASGGVLLESTFFTGPKRIADTLARGSTQGIDAYKTLFASEVRVHVPWGGTLKDVEQAYSMIDATFGDGETGVPQNDISTMGGAMASAIPFAVALGARPALNRWGNPMKYDRGRFIGTKEKDPIDKWMYDNNIFVPGISSTVKTVAPDGNPTVMTSAERYEYVKKTGKTLRSAVESEFDSLRGMSVEEAKKWIDNTASEIRSEAKGDNPTPKAATSTSDTGRRSNRRSNSRTNLRRN